MQAVHGAATNRLVPLVPCAVHAIRLRRFHNPTLQPSTESRRSQLSAKWSGSIRCGSAVESQSMSAAVHGANATSADSVTEGGSKLWKRLQNVYDTALANGDVFKTDTDDKVYQDPALNVGFVLRVAAALNSKPKPAKPDGRQGDLLPVRVRSSLAPDTTAHAQSIHALPCVHAAAAAANQQTLSCHTTRRCGSQTFHTRTCVCSTSSMSWRTMRWS